jgi:polyhydroxybutyrate depolymerase
VLKHDGLEREYFVFLPSAYNSKSELPALLFIHGYGGTATGTEIEVTQGLNAYAEKFGYIVIYPQSTWFAVGDSPETNFEVTSWNHISDGFDQGPEGPICTEDVVKSPCPPECGSCGNCGWASCNDDVGFLKSLILTVSSDFAIDKSSVFVSGFSNGSMMANRIACEASEMLAGVALVGGRVEPGFECTPTKSIPLLQINGGFDQVVPHDGSASGGAYFFATTASVSKYWNDGRSCALETSNWTSLTIEGENVQCLISCGDTNSPSIDCVWPEGNHRWPGTAGFRGSNGYCVTELQTASMPGKTLCIAADPDAEFWGSQLIFEFFDNSRT